MNKKLILAPLLGVTGTTFRSIFHNRFTGFTAALAPFITTTHGNPASRSHFKDILPENNRDSMPVIPQLIGKDGHDFVTAANRIHDDFGYTEVNWNIGCPAPTVAARMRGAGILSHPEVIDAFLDTVCGAIKPKLSVKMRLGMESPDEYQRLIPILNAYPIAEITVHPRTGVQLYDGHADVEHFAHLFAALKSPVMYNGDITTTDFARKILARFPTVSGLMIGRGAIANPFLPQAILDDVSEVKLFDARKLKNLHDELYAVNREGLSGGPTPLLGRMKELWKYWAVHLETERVLRNILKAKTIDEYRSASMIAFASMHSDQ